MSFGQEAFNIMMSLISSAIYDAGRGGWDRFTAKSPLEKNRNARQEVMDELGHELNLKLDSFMKRHEECLFLDSDWFCNFLKYQNPLNAIMESITGDVSKDTALSPERVMDRLVCDTERAAAETGRRLGSMDKSVVRELYQLLADTIRDTLNGQMDLALRFGLNEIRQDIRQANEAHNAGTERMAQGRKTAFSEKHYAYPVPHIRRYCQSLEKPLAGEGGRADGFQLADICRNHPFVVLLGEAGNGKSTELLWVAARFGADPALPRPVLLTLKTYMDETIEKLAEKQGCFIEEEQELFFLIDGFDEISGGNRQNFLKQLTVYHEQRPKARFLVSARNHFYRQGMLGDFFETVWMEPLGFEDAIAFVRECGIDDGIFLDEIDQHHLRELLRIPFYLTELCVMYQEKGSLPDRNQLMRELIEHKFAEDSKKFRMTMAGDLSEQKFTLFSGLERIAAAMHAMDCRCLPEKDYRALIPDEKDRKLLSYSGIWKLQEGGWQFTHNNFAEYLAAEYLSQRPADEVKKLVSAGCPELGICGNWHHVLSYLLLTDHTEIGEWLLEEDFTLFLDVDINRIPASRRSKILRREWERLKRGYEWITRQRYRPGDLMRFGVNYLEIGMFLEEIRNPADVIAMQNAILALSYCPNLFGRDDEARDTLMEVCRSPQEEAYAHERAILALLELDLMGEGGLETLMAIFQDTDSAEVRYALYRSIRVMGKADAYIGFLTGGLGYVCGGKGRLGNESFELHYALMEVEEPSASLEILRVLTEHREYFHIYHIDQVVEHIFSGFTDREERFTGDEWNLLAAFYEAVSSRGLHKLEDVVLNYFSSAGQRAALCEYELKRIAEGRRSWIYIRRLMDGAAAGWALERYKNGGLEDAQIRECLYFMGRDNEVFRELRALYSEKTGIQLEDRPWIDYNALLRQGKAKYQSAITCKEMYLSLLDELIGLYGKEDLTEKDLAEGHIEEDQNRYDLMDIRFDYVRRSGAGTVQEWKMCVEREWEDVQGYLLFDWLYAHENEKTDVPAAIGAAARVYFDKNITDVDLSRAVRWETDETRRITERRAQRILYFAWAFDFPMKKQRAEGILACAWFLEEERIRTLLERYFTKEELMVLVRENMLHHVLKGDDLGLHLRYCKEFRIRECAERIRKIAVDDSRSDWVRRRAIEYFYQVIGAEETCQAILPFLDGRLFVDTVSKTAEYEPEGLADLLWEYAQRKEDAREVCYKYLIQLQDKRGLRAYREMLEERRRIEKDLTGDGLLSGIAAIRKEELWEEVFQLVGLWCQPDFEDAEFGGLARVLGLACSRIAGSGARGYEAVKAMLGERMKEETEFYKKAQLKHWMTEAEGSYRQSVQRKWSVDEVKRYIV